MGIMFFAGLALIEIFFFVWSVITKNRHTTEKAVVRIAEGLLLVVLLLTGVFEWSFRYYGILILLGIQAIVGVVRLVRRDEEPYSLGKSVFALISCVLLFAIALLPAIVFPQYAPLARTGPHAVATAEFVWTDSSRDESFTVQADNRVVNVDFWYPQETGSYPLVIFSHGAFGLSYSNESTFVELASNGYVVASIGHPYHAFYAKNENGSPILVNMDFLNSVYAVNAMEDSPEKQEIIDAWMDVRVQDMRYVLSAIEGNVKSAGSEPFDRINLDRIGLMGHSLGGAAAAQVGREVEGIDAVVVLDGTMLGEVTGYEGSTQILNSKPYPVSLLNIYTRDHYQDALPYGSVYPNINVTQSGVDTYVAVLDDAGHLNMTDLPLFSPFLARVLGVGSIDARYGVEMTNEWTLAFFEYALKDGKPPQFEKEQ